MVTTKRPISWFLTTSGRKFSYALVAGTGIALTAAKFVPHTLLLYKYKEFVQYYSNGKPVAIPKELMERYQSCLDLLSLSEIHRKLVSPFNVFGFDLFHAGSTSSKFGAAVGIPVNFKYKNIEDVANDDIQVNQKKVDFTTEVGKMLADALILPEKVQQFAICREILMSHSYKCMVESTYPFTCIFVVYNLSQYLNHRLNLYIAPASLRLTMYSIIGMFGLGTYFLLKDMTQVYYETKVDQTLCELGKDFVESGVIFYEKILKRNQALRELMGREGERKYTKLGNENYFIRQPHIALVHRKQYFEESLKELENVHKEETDID